ncbi:hypothetical protein J437_LFUL017460 [Ladona fulva]|uniref:CCHC-type domain-containing protein n=1 Tax=Ladona fulva TaxID=123851 RepID=A0A8K0KQG3_LADFU|nr:hypothetical protein J437_LFUL017460 [Ladona fulva]
MEIGAALADIKKEFKIDLMTEIRELRTLSEDIYEAIKVEEAAKKKVSYAEVVKDLQEGSKEKKELIIMAKDNSNVEDLNKIKEIVKSTINPGKEAIKIKTMRTAGRRKVIIETMTQEDKDKLYKGQLKDKLESKGLIIESIKKKQPRLIIFSIDRNVPEKEFTANVYSQNLKETEIEEGKFIQGFKHLFTTGRRESKYCNKVYEVTPEIRDALINKDKLYAGWESHYEKDYLGVTRCFKCQGFGHMAKTCREKEDICSHCARSGQKIQDCPNKNKEETCANCHRFGKDAAHSTWDRECPAYKFALEREILRTKYVKN